MSDKNNTGKSNIGSCNSGDGNIGHYNSGDGNSGDRNSGDYNIGNYNSGYRNSGYYNSGNYNSGYRNSGDYNSGDRNSGYFNTNEPTARLFNKDTGKKRSEICIPSFDLKITEWIAETKMTDIEKKENPLFNVAGGYLKKRDYKDAWLLAWSEMEQEIKQQFLNLPNFDADIFLEITGVDVRKATTCSGKVVEIDGKKYRLEEI